MHIESDIKLGFKDVMLRPKRSTLSSRSEVSLIRKFKFLHSGGSWEGIPIMAANMDTTGTMEMAKVLASHQLFTAIHKHYTVEQWKKFMQGGGENIIASALPGPAYVLQSNAVTIFVATDCPRNSTSSDSE